MEEFAGYTEIHPSNYTKLVDEVRGHLFLTSLINGQPVYFWTALRITIFFLLLMELTNLNYINICKLFRNIETWLGVLCRSHSSSNIILKKKKKKKKKKRRQKTKKRAQMTKIQTPTMKFSFQSWPNTEGAMHTIHSWQHRSELSKIWSQLSARTVLLVDYLLNTRRWIISPNLATPE